MWVSIGSGTGMKPLPEPVLTNHQSSCEAFTWGQFHGNAQDIYPRYEFENSYSDITTAPLRGQRVNLPGTPFTFMHWLTIFPAWISNHMSSKVWGEITYPFPNFNGCTVDVWECCFIPHFTVETLYSTIYHSKYFIELNIDKSTQYVALWTHKRHPIPRPFGRAMECLLWVFQQKLMVL